MAQAVSRWPVTAEARVRLWVSHVGFAVDKEALELVFVRVLVFLCQYHSTVAPYSYVNWGMNSRPIGDRSSET
jgi:hypothetical protein